MRCIFIIVIHKIPWSEKSLQGQISGVEKSKMILINCLLDKANKMIQMASLDLHGNIEEENNQDYINWDLSQACDTLKQSNVVLVAEGHFLKLERIKISLITSVSPLSVLLTYGGVES